MSDQPLWVRAAPNSIAAHDYQEVVKQRDELLAVGRDILKMLEACGYGGSNVGTANRHERRLRKAIQRVPS